MPFEDELEEMDKAFTLGGDEEDPTPPAEEPTEPEPVEPEPEPVVNEEDPEPEPEPEPVPEPSEIDILKQELADLKSKLKEPEPPTPEPEPELELEDQDFLGEDDPYDLTQDSSKFNALLNKVYKAGINAGRKVVGEGVLKTIPDIVRSNLTAMVALQREHDKFYEENKDLQAHRSVVANVFQEISSAKPGLGVSDYLKEVGPEVRKRLGLKAEAKQDDKPPRLPKPKGKGVRPDNKPETDPLMKEIEDMNKALLGG